MRPRTLGPRTAAAALLLALGATFIAPLPRAAATTADDYCQGQCDDILPPGENGNATLADILANRVLGTHPAHTDDQLAEYGALASGYPGLTGSTLTNFFNDASFGVPQDQAASVESPRPDVTITRDKAIGVPHIQGTARYGTEFGAGYAAAEDRLWLMDLFRHVGRGELTSFAGGAAANQGLEQQFWRLAPYTESDLQAQINCIADHNGTRGRQALPDPGSVTGEPLVYDRTGSAAAAGRRRNGRLRGCEDRVAVVHRRGPRGRRREEGPGGGGSGRAQAAAGRLPQRRPAVRPVHHGRRQAGHVQRPAADYTADRTPPAQHPQSVDQDYYISWNNKQAKDYSAAAFGDGSVHRANLLDVRVEKLVRRGGVTAPGSSRPWPMPPSPTCGARTSGPACSRY